MFLFASINFACVYLEIVQVSELDDVVKLKCECKKIVAPPNESKWVQLEECDVQSWPDGMPFLFVDIININHTLLHIYCLHDNGGF